jgi:hypothetical protein
MSERVSQVVFLTGRVIHQGTGKPPIGQVHVTAREGPLLSRILEDGTIALSGDLALLLPKPHVGPYQFNLTFEVISPQFKAGKLLLQRLQPVPSNLDFAPNPPAIPAPPVNMGIILLPADPVNLRGRVVQARNPNTAISGATVRVTSPLGTNTTTSSATGAYRLDNLLVQAPATISCTMNPTFKPINRVLQLDYRLPVNEEQFQLLPV